MAMLGDKTEPLRAVEQDGFTVLRRLVPAEARETALRRIHLELMRLGLSAEQIAAYHETKVWFPHLRWEPEILQLLEGMPAELREGELCDPQILLHLPDEATEWPLVPHTDTTPPWAGERPYRLILGVALTPGRVANGGLVVWPFGREEPEPVELEPGDVVLMHPQLPHCGCLNREGAIRYAIYFRFLAD
jgi:hypothetical protein